jgi:PAS domain S-box-containing protein
MPLESGLSKEQLLELLEAERTARAASSAESDQLLRDLRVQQGQLETRIRELAESRKRLEDSRSRYAQLYDFAPTAHCTVARDGTIEECNLALGALAGVDRAQATGLSLAMLIAPADQGLFANHLERCFTLQRRVTTELRLSLPLLGVVPFQVVSTPVTAENGSLVGCHTVLTDVSAVKRSEERLGLLAKTSATLFSSFDITANLAAVVRSLVPTVADLCVADVIELDGRVRRVEVAAVDAVPAHVVEALRAPPEQLEVPEVPLLRSGIGGARFPNPLAVGASGEQAIAALATKSMMRVPVRVRDRALGVLAFVKLDPGRAYTSSDLAFTNDLASRVGTAIDNARLFAEAQRAVKARQELLSIVSHDLRSPITGVLLSADALMKGTPTDDRRKGRKHVMRIRRNMMQMRRMVEDLLDLGSLEKGHLSIHCAEYKLGSLLEEAVEVLEAAALDQGITLAVDAMPEVWVRCDRERVLQVLSNLVGNALRFTPKDGRVTLSAGAHRGKVRIRVQDTGPGIPTVLLRNLFERERRLSDPHKKGRGLGLYICKGIVEAHGGSIWAESKEGEGASLFFTLPSVRAAELRESGPVVLLADSDESVRLALSDILQRHGYRVVQAANGREALDYLETGAVPESVVVDLSMPVMDGRELLRAMKQRQHLAQIPVILMSSGERLDDETRLGVAEALHKPPDIARLLHALSTKTVARA